MPVYPGAPESVTEPITVTNDNATGLRLQIHSNGTDGQP
jgi:hypothetical protein